VKLPSFEAGEATVYGEWDDCDDYQFIVIWREAGETCTVISLSGCDYRGGVTVYSANMPVKEVEAIVNSDFEYLGTAKKQIEKLIEQYP